MSDASITYARASHLDRDGLALSTSGGRAEHPYFFRGFLDNAEQSARAMLAIADVSRSRYFDPGRWARMKDPVVTSNVSVLRFEAFSSCNGVYARFDVDDGGFDSDYVDWGTTNVDLNEPVRKALAGVVPGAPLRLTVGADAVEVQTLGGAVIENKVPLSERWLRGFAEAQIAAAEMRPVAQFSAVQARALARDLHKLKSSPRTPWVSLAGGRARLTTLATTATPCLVGPQRLAALAALARYATGLTVYAPGQRRRVSGSGDAIALQASAWVLHLDRARLTLVVSPELYRGFSGEGAVLSALANVPEQDVARVSAELGGQARLSPGEIAQRTGLTEVRVSDALKVLGAAGRTGFDLATGAFFHRDLPCDRAALADTQPRLKDAWELVAARAVGPARATVGDGESAWDVRSGELTYRVVLGADDRCNCPWFAKHRGERGPCKHVLAAGLAAEGVGSHHGVAERALP